MNTLLDSLSNETMLAIAKGLQPLGREAGRRQAKVDARRADVAIGVFGAGYVGLVTGACFADLGHDVVVRDISPSGSRRSAPARVPIHEPGLDELLARNRERLSLHARRRARRSTAPSSLFVAVGTPPTYSGDADLSAVWTVVDELPARRRRR